MTDVKAAEDNGSTNAAKDSIIESFEIMGLHGFRSISLSSQYAATILIARNGSGKTTLLGALDAFLKRHFHRLRDLEFREIHCKLRDCPSITLRHDEVAGFVEEVSAQPDITKLSAQLRIAPSTMVNFLVEDWPTVKESTRRLDEGTFGEILRYQNYSYAKAEELCDRLLQDIRGHNPVLLRISEQIESALRGFDIVYLPTYRRVELALRKDAGDSPRQRQRPKFNVAGGSLFTGDIQFGLSDISERLSELNSLVVNQSNAGYGKLSSNIINQLLDGSYEHQTQATPPPSQEDLELLFSRITGRSYMGPYYHLSIPKIEKIYNPNVSPNVKTFLDYFLRQLSQVIDATRDVERRVQQFVEGCNKYLRSEELTTQRRSEDGSAPIVDGKELRLNRQDLSVQVYGVPGDKQIPLDALSSGEKQMISLFAKVFLYDGNKIVLIDEPELSLSIDWQREILVDVLNAPLCKQVVAITHSPFVFDNELEPFARALRIRDDI